MPLAPDLLRTAALLATLVLPMRAHALLPNESVDLSPDISVTLDGDADFHDEEVIIDDQVDQSLNADDLGPLPTGADLVGYHLLDNGDQLFALDTSVALAGGVDAARGDVVRYDGSVYSIEFDASAEGIPAGAQVDAISMSSGDLVLSFDVSVSLGGNTYSDEDLVVFDGAVFSLYFDGSAAGLDIGLDLDGAHHFPGSGLLGLSFDGSGTIGGVAFDDEDVVEVDPSGPTWRLAWDGSARDSGWSPADVDAVHFVPEPHRFLLAAAAMAALRLLRRRA